MAEAQVVPVGSGGFFVPPVPTGATVHERSTQLPTIPGPVQPAQPGSIPDPARRTVDEHGNPIVATPFAPQTPVAQPGLDPATLAAFLAFQAAQKAAPVVPAKEAEAVKPADLSAELQTISDPATRDLIELLSITAPNLDLDRFGGKALERGDIGLLDLAYLKEIYPNDVDKIVNVAKKVLAASTNYAKSVETTVYAEAGNKENWDAAVAFFNTNAPQHQRAAIAQMMDQGGAGTQGGAKFVIEFARNNGAIADAAGLVQAGAGMQTTAAEALDKDGFQAEIRKLNPEDRGYLNQLNDLKARRLAGRNRGL